MKKKTRTAKSMVMQPQYASKGQKDRTKYNRKNKHKTNLIRELDHDPSTDKFFSNTLRRLLLKYG